MSFRTLLVIFLAVGCGVSSALGFSLILSGQQKSPDTTETVNVLVAKLPIARGRLLSSDLVEVKAWPKNLAPQTTLSKLEDVTDRAALQAMVAGEPIFDFKLALKGVVGGMASLIPPGKRAYTIQTKTSASKVAGFVLPGNRVDVLLTFRGQTNDETGGGSTTTLLQAVEVLAVGKHIETLGHVEMVDAQEMESVTILVTPEQVARLDLGQTLGMLSLSLRNPNDLEEPRTSSATIADIRFGPEKFDSQKMFGMLGAIVSAVRGAIPKAEPVLAEPAVPEPPREVAQTAILTLRGQTWGAVRVRLPEPQAGQLGQARP